MAPKNNPFEIPEGWVLDTRVKRDVTEIKGFFCPATGQEFYTYDALMRHISYAIPAQVSIHSPVFQANKPQKEASSKAGMNSSSSQSSNSLVTEQGEKSIDPACSIQKPDPKRKGKSSTSRAKKKQQRKQK
ncbi:uncharacterized protein Pyn_01349 [Prunus yedoensis var. nudiflora]|uniref:MBD domain-containing protein n=1 Tax=Prunus yedoensis var. nudiflora TaxID=2094558 RepID=A0A314YP07_PRUYE|nr:uncharacterized protein Pyn_01349 [Prunus yedoensis var. nudiflora]